MRALGSASVSGSMMSMNSPTTQWRAAGAIDSGQHLLDKGVRICELCEIGWLGEHSWFPCIDHVVTPGVP
jgi:hypothetical protein